MRPIALRICLSGFLVSALPALVQASLEYSSKTEGAELFRTQTLEPPPLAALPKGETLKVLHRGIAQSLVETSGGLKGWMRNEDLQAREWAPGQKVRFAEQKVTGGGEANISPFIFDSAPSAAQVVSLDRSFTGEIAESIDKEQVEMRNGEN